MSFSRMRVAALTVLWLAMAAGAQPTNTIVQRIRTDYARLQRALPTLRVVRRDANLESAEGSTLVGYYTRADVLRTMTVTVFGETGKSVDEYYLLPDDCVFVLRSVMRYDKPLGKVVATKQTRLYVSKGKLIRHLEGTRALPIDTPAARKTARQVQAEVEQFKALLLSPASDE